MKDKNDANFIRANFKYPEEKMVYNIIFYCPDFLLHSQTCWYPSPVH